VISWWGLLAGSSVKAAMPTATVRARVSRARCRAFSPQCSGEPTGVESRVSRSAGAMSCASRRRCWASQSTVIGSTEHIKRFGVVPDGQVFRNQAGNYVDASAYGITWARARKHVLTRTELASGLAKRPYDLRHAGISFWLYSGVDSAECARRAGPSIEDSFRYYAKFPDGVREQANRLIEQSMQEWDRVSRGVVPEG
jgi:hypothetical protein